MSGLGVATVTIILSQLGQTLFLVKELIELRKELAALTVHGARP